MKGHGITFAEKKELQAIKVIPRPPKIEVIVLHLQRNIRLQA